MTGNALCLITTQRGPTELFLPGGGIEDGGGGSWFVWGVLLVVFLLVGVWARAIGQRRVDPRELAFRSLGKRLKLSHKQMAGVREIGIEQGIAPVGLLICPSVGLASSGDQAAAHQTQ